MSSPQLSLISTTVRELLNVIEEARVRRVSRDRILRLIDELENQVDLMLTEHAPERITDERFETAVRALRELSKLLKELRAAVLMGRFHRARELVLDVQEMIRHVYRILLLAGAGSPVTTILQVAPPFLREIEIPAPEALTQSNPLAAQIYNVLLRKGEATIEELALELKIDDKTRDEFNKAISQLIAMGYVKTYLTPNNKLVLRPAR